MVGEGVTSWQVEELPRGKRSRYLVVGGEVTFGRRRSCLPCGSRRSYLVVAGGVILDGGSAREAWIQGHWVHLVQYPAHLAKVVFVEVPHRYDFVFIFPAEQ